MKRELDERIADWVAARLSPRDLERLEAEFEVNSKLRQAAEEYREAVEQVRRALAEPESPVDLVDRVVGEIQLQRAQPRLGKALPFLASFAAAAATILLFLALYRVEPAADPLETAKAEAEEVGGAEGASVPARDERLELDLAAGDRAAEGVRRLNTLDDVLRRSARARDATPDTGAAGKAAGLGGEDRDGNLRAEPAPGAPSAAPSVPAHENLAWLRQVVSGPDVAPTDQELDAHKEGQEDNKLALGLLADRADLPSAGSGTPVVAFNLPAGESLLTAESRDPNRGVQEFLRQMQTARSVEKAQETEISGGRELKNQDLQETLDWALVPENNARPPILEEFDPQSRQTLQTLQSAVGFSDVRTQQSYFFANRPAEEPVVEVVEGRAFRLQGDREAVARFLRRVSDWGHAQGAVVEIGQVAEEVVRQSRIDPQAQVAGALREVPRTAPEVQGPLLESRRGGRGGGRRGWSEDARADQISVLLLFQSGALGQKKDK